MAKRIGEILVELGEVTPGEVDAALQAQKKAPKKERLKIGEYLVDQRACKGEAIAKALATQHKRKYCNLRKTLEKGITEECVEAISKETAKKHQIVPLKKTRRNLIVATCSPIDFMALEDLRFVVGMDIDYVIASDEAVKEALGNMYGIVEESDLDKRYKNLVGDDGDEISFGGVTEEDYDEIGNEETPIVKLVNKVIANAVGSRASDIHFEPMEKKVRVRFRIDGQCIEQEPLPKKLQGSIISRLKIMSKMRPEEKRVPQDGNIKMRLAKREIDFRVNALPATHGESVVLRILDKEKALVDLEDLGMHRTDFQKFENIIRRPNGIFLVTGPTGSGKTTTLYAALKKLNRPDIKIITAENPVEYSLPGINQAQVRHEIGFTFARILKAMLRQAPNIILVGEIRDEETANTAIEAALTGHLVFSTLHTNDAASSISRLIDMGVKPFLVASAVLAILAQRLVRRLCPKCKTQVDPSDEDLRAVGLKRDQLKGRKVYDPGGCDACSKGYKGRLGVYELLEMTPTLRDLAFKGVPTKDLKEAAVGGGMSTLQADGVRKVIKGLTSFEEVLGITHRKDMAY